MSKRKVALPPPHSALLPPCKRRVWTRHCTPEHPAPRRKRKLEPESAPLVEAPSSSECERLLAPAASSPPPSKRLRVSESRPAAEFQCQKDEAFCEFNSFQYWKTPLPDVDFSELAVEAGEDTSRVKLSVADVLEEMDS